MRRRLLSLLVLAACHDTGSDRAPVAAASDEDFVTFPPGATVDEVLKAVDGRPGEKEGLKTPGHGTFFFVILRDGERHGASYRQDAFHAVIGAGATMPEGTLLVRRVWAASGQIDGTNEQPEGLGVSIAVEPGATKPYSDAVRTAATTFVVALARRIPLHPDCVLAMGEVAYANPHATDPAERDLAKAVRAHVEVPPPDGRIIIRTKRGEVPVDVERRTKDGIQVGMMFRNRFDGDARGMLFEYPHADYRRFWMKNCRIAIDVAYINRGRIEQIHTMAPGFGLDQKSLRYYESGSTANLALEMPGGWFAEHGVEPGDGVSNLQAAEK